MFNDIASLCAETITQDDYGNEIKTLAEREIFCQVRSIGMREFFNAALTAYHPTTKIVLSDASDYDDEKVIKYDNNVFDVVRTYKKGHGLEITLQERVGGDGRE